MSTLRLFLLALAAAASAAPNDVWSPRIIQPNATTVWTVGQTYNVTWDTSDAPGQISNGAGILLNKDGLRMQFLAQTRSFDLRAGFKEVTVPDVEPGSNYSITLFGDSGNMSDDFVIKGPNPVDVVL